MKFIMTMKCDRCGLVCVEDELTVCIHYDTEEVLGRLCEDCVQDWLKHLDTLEDDVDDA